MKHCLTCTCQIGQVTRHIDRMVVDESAPFYPLVILCDVAVYGPFNPRGPDMRRRENQRKVKT